MICKVCKRYFRPQADKKYIVKIDPVGLQCLTERTKYLECFDCPKCGCQNMANIREDDPESKEV